MGPREPLPSAFSPSVEKNKKINFSKNDGCNVSANIIFVGFFFQLLSRLTIFFLIFCRCIISLLTRCNWMNFMKIKSPRYDIYSYLEKWRERHASCSTVCRLIKMAGKCSNSFTVLSPVKMAGKIEHQVYCLLSRLSKRRETFVSGLLSVRPSKWWRKSPSDPTWRKICQMDFCLLACKNGEKNPTPDFHAGLLKSVLMNSFC